MENQITSGIYVVHPISEELTSIFKQKNRPDYKTKVSNAHTKVGKTENFRSGQKRYIDNFKDVNFQPILEIDKENLAQLEIQILIELKKRYSTVGRSREWFNTSCREDIIKLIIETAKDSNIRYKNLYK